MTSENKPAGRSSGERDSIIVCRTSQGYEVRATPLRITRHVVAFEVYNPYSILQLSEVLQEFRIIVNDRLIYSGRATVSNLVNTGILVVCEATLAEAWLDVIPSTSSPSQKSFGTTSAIFSRIGRGSTRSCPNTRSYWRIAKLLYRLEALARAGRVGHSLITHRDGLQLEREVLQELVPSVLPSINSLFDRFEEVADKVIPNLLPFHRTYAKRQLHPLVLCSPFAYRTYHKPLGYAGDYEMVNMILRDPLEGSSLFAKSVNLWF